MSTGSSLLMISMSWRIDSIQIGIERRPGAHELLMILGAGQRRKEEELQHVDGELSLDDLDVVADRLDRVAGKSEDVAGVRDDARVLPRQKHFPILGDLVLALLRADQA